MKFSAKFAPCLLAGLLLNGCGGGGNLTSTQDNNNTNNTITWVSGEFAPSDTFKGQCVALNEKHWLRSWSNETYLWYDEIVDRNPADTPNVLDYFNLLKTEQLTDSGARKDNFHFNMSTAEWDALNQSGVSLGYGFEFVLKASSPPRKAIISYTEPNTEATTQNLLRGYEIVSIDGVDFVNGDDVNTLNAGLFPDQQGKLTEFVFLDPNTNEERTVTLTAAEITSTPVQNGKVLQTASGNVGYFQFNSHIATAERGLFNVITQMKNNNVSDLVVDLRYNGGGLLAMAAQLGYMIAGEQNTQNRIFEQTVFNDKHPTINPVTGQPLTPLPFIDFYIGFDPNSGIADETPLPSLGLDRVFVLTTGNTCSASEALINGLRGADIEVIQIGSTSCGKPYGFYPTDNCDTTYFTIQFSGINDKGFGEYSDGFTPLNTLDNDKLPVRIPGCAVADDFSKQLGDPTERLLATALDYRDTGTCPAPSSFSSLNGFAAEETALQVKDKRSVSQLRTNRIITPVM